MGRGMSLRAAGAVLDPPAAGQAPDEAALDFQRDLLAPYGRELDEERYRKGAGVTHRALTDLLLADAGVQAARPQLVIVTHALPDVVPFTAVAPYLAHRLEGAELRFGIAQQGLAAPFTALRVADAYYRAGRCRDVVITVLEQTTLPTAMPLVDDTPLVDSAAALVLGGAAAGASDGASGAGSGAEEESGLQLAGVASGDSAAALLHDRISGPDDLVVLGPWVPDLDLADRPVHRAAAGTYCTSVWLALAQHRTAWQREHPAVLLCDTDPRTGRSHVAVLRAAAAGPDPDPAPREQTRRNQP